MKSIGFLSAPLQRPAPIGRWFARHAANLLTILRLLLVAPVVLLVLVDAPLARLGAALLFLTAGLTDLFDGYVARRLQQVSALGAFLDPLADKLLVDGALVALAVHGEVPWLLVAFLLARDAGITLLRARSPTRRAQLRPSTLAKRKTASLVVGVALLLLGTAAAGLAHTLLVGLAWVVIGLAMLLTVASLVEYAIRPLVRRAPSDGAPQ
ncbi:MAG: CDP-diacylglycerol--glycerol-3-phosphate 3-phosphatidyltransferase [Dehalococcoidia bacterium]